MKNKELFLALDQIENEYNNNNLIRRLPQK